LPDAARPGIVVPMPHRTAALLIALLLPVAVAAGCGESAADKAQDDVCAARDDIAKQVDELKGLTLTTATVAGVQQNLSTIRDGLEQIRSAQKSLNKDRRAEVKAATDEFVSTVTSVVKGLRSDVSLSEARSRITQAAQDLGAAFPASLGRIDCS
jgi:phage-related protein